MWNLQCKTQFSKGKIFWLNYRHGTIFHGKQIQSEVEWNRYHLKSLLLMPNSELLFLERRKLFCKEEIPRHSLFLCHLLDWINHFACFLLHSKNVTKFYSERNISKKCRAAIHSPPTNLGQCQMSRSQKGAVDVDGKFLKIKSRYLREKYFLL